MSWVSGRAQTEFDLWHLTWDKVEEGYLLVGLAVVLVPLLVLNLALELEGCMGGREMGSPLSQMTGL